MVFAKGTSHVAGMRRILALLAALGLVVALGCVAGWQASPAPASARALEATLLSPCCFGGTIDVHDSDLSRALRREIEARVAAGEPTLAIEADLVARYGPQIRAMPKARALLGLTVAVMLFVVGSGATLLSLMFRRRAAAGRTPPPASSVERDAYDDRLDAELEALD